MTTLPPVPPEYEAIAAQLEQHAAALRDLGRHGARALGEGEDLLDALWALGDELDARTREIDAITTAIISAEEAREDEEIRRAAIERDLDDAHEPPLEWDSEMDPRGFVP